MRLVYREERGLYEIQWFEQGQRKRRSTGTGCRATAEKALAEQILARDKPATNEQPEKRRIADVLAKYILDHAGNTARPEDTIHFCEILNRFWENKTVAEISKASCQRYWKHRRDEFTEYQARKYTKARLLSDNTIRRELEVLRAALRLDEKEKRLTVAPHIWMPEKPAPKQRWLTHKEAARLLRAARAMPDASDYLPLYILMGLYTVARKEAILTRRWPDVDFQREIIDNGQGNKVKRRTKVPMPRRLKRELLKARLRGTETGFVIHRNQVPIKNIRRSFMQACEIAGLTDVTPHTLKHTGVSWMVQKGVPLYLVAKWSATTVGMIERVYGHLAPEHLDEIKRAFG